MWYFLLGYLDAIERAHGTIFWPTPKVTIGSNIFFFYPFAGSFARLFAPCFWSPLPLSCAARTPNQTDRQRKLLAAWGKRRLFLKVQLQLISGCMRDYRSSLKSFNHLWNPDPLTPLKGIFYHNISKAVFNLQFFLYKVTLISFYSR